MKSLFVIAMLLFLSSCKKQDTSPGPGNPPNIPPPVETAVRLSINQINATPGDILEIKTSTKVTASEVSINFKNVTTKAFLKNDSTYLFVVPVVEAGGAIISIPGFKNSNSMSLTIDAYKVISSPQVIVTEFLTKRNAMIDSLIKPRPGYNLHPSPESINRFSQMKAEWDVQYAGLSTSEKEIIAYVMQKNMPDPSTLSITALQTGYFAKESFGINDAGDKLVATAKVYVTAQVICISQIPFVVAGAYLLGSAPSFLTGALFLVPYTTFVIALEVAKMRAEETGTLPGVVEEINDVSFAAKNILTLKFQNNTERDLNMTVNLRNLAFSDANIHSAVSTAFNTEQKFIEEESILIDLYRKVTALFSKLKDAYTPHNKIIGNVSKRSIEAQVEGSQIKVTGVSDSRISFSTRMEGASKKIKVTSTSTSDIDFNLKVSYVRSLDGKEFTKDIPCTFVAAKPASISIVSGNKQSGNINSTLANPLVVVVKDIDGNLMADVPVSWIINSGGGQLTTSSSVTGSNGQASNSWKVGPGGAQSVSAILKKADGSHVSGSPLAFSATLNPAPGSLSIVSGNNQSATANSAVSKPLVVLVKDMDGSPMSGVTVSWSVNSGGGQLIFPNSTTGANGEASNNWKLGPSGTQSVSASVKKSDGSNVNGSPVGFSATIQTETLHKIVSVGVGNFTDIGKVCPSYDNSATGIIRINFDGQTAPSTGAIKITHMWDNDGDGQFEGSNSGNTTDISSLSKTGNQVSITNGICWGGKKTVVKIEVQYINGTYSSNIVTSIVPRP